MLHVLQINLNQLSFLCVMNVLKMAVLEKLGKSL